MIGYATVLAMVIHALPGLPRAQQAADAHAVVTALREVANEAWKPSAAMVVAIMWRESRGIPHVCGNDRFGGSARGLMGIRRGASRCRDARYSALYQETTNVREGVRILIAWHRLLSSHPGGRDIFDGYSGNHAHSHYADQVRAMTFTLSHLEDSR